MMRELKGIKEMSKNELIHSSMHLLLHIESLSGIIADITGQKDFANSIGLDNLNRYSEAICGSIMVLSEIAYNQLSAAELIEG